MLVDVYLFMVIVYMLCTVDVWILPLVLLWLEYTCICLAHTPHTPTVIQTCARYGDFPFGIFMCRLMNVTDLANKFIGPHLLVGLSAHCHRTICSSHAEGEAVRARPRTMCVQPANA
jgi:hypothetical protein